MFDLLGYEGIGELYLWLGCLCPELIASLSRESIQFTWQSWMRLSIHTSSLDILLISLGFPPLGGV